jgi:hypothetical protein
MEARNLNANFTITCHGCQCQCDAAVPLAFHSGCQHRDGHGGGKFNLNLKFTGRARALNEFSLASLFKLFKIPDCSESESRGRRVEHSVPPRHSGWAATVTDSDTDRHGVTGRGHGASMS